MLTSTHIQAVLGFQEVVASLCWQRSKGCYPTLPIRRPKRLLANVGVPLPHLLYIRMSDYSLAKGCRVRR